MAQKPVRNLLEEVMSRTVLVVPTWDRRDLLDRCVETAKKHARIDDVVVVEQVFPRRRQETRAYSVLPMTRSS